MATYKTEIKSDDNTQVTITNMTIEEAMTIKGLLNGFESLTEDNTTKQRTGVFLRKSDKIDSILQQIKNAGITPEKSL